MSSLERRVAKIERGMGLGQPDKEPTVVVIVVKHPDDGEFDYADAQELLGPYREWLTCKQLVAEEKERGDSGLGSVLFLPHIRTEFEARGLPMPKENEQGAK